MPEIEGRCQVLPLRILDNQRVLLSRATALDGQFLKDIVSDSSTPQYGGYSTEICRETGHTLKPRIEAVYKPLIDMMPSDPSTILTAMCEAQKETKRRGQTFTVLTADQQLYRVIVHVKWAYPKLFETLIPRLGVCTC